MPLSSKYTMYPPHVTDMYNFHSTRALSPMPLSSKNTRALTSSSKYTKTMIFCSSFLQGKAGTESLAVIVDIEAVGSRKDNYRIRFEDGRERNVSEDKLKAVDTGDKVVDTGDHLPT